jgi:hypothetical protein
MTFNYRVAALENGILLRSTGNPSGQKPRAKKYFHL